MKAASLCPYLTFDGDCKEALEFYKSCLGGKLEIQTFGESGHSPDPSMNDRVMHGMITSGDISFMASDTMPGVMEFSKGNNVQLALVGTDDAKLRGYFQKLSAGGKVTMPLAKQFWGDVYGTFTDKFGMYWMVDIGQKKD